MNIKPITRTRKIEIKNEQSALSERFQLSFEGFRYEIVRDCEVLTAIRTTFTLFLRLLLKSVTTDQTETDSGRPEKNTKVLLVSYTVNHFFR